MLLCQDDELPEAACLFPGKVRGIVAGAVGHIGKGDLVQPVPGPLHRQIIGILALGVLGQQRIVEVPHGHLRVGFAVQERRLHRRGLLCPLHRQLQIPAQLLGVCRCHRPLGQLGKRRGFRLAWGFRFTPGLALCRR